MSILTGCICQECNEWHSNIVNGGWTKKSGEWEIKYVCVNCRYKKRVRHGERS